MRWIVIVWAAHYWIRSFPTCLCTTHWRFNEAYHIELKFSKVIPEGIWFSKAYHIELKFSKVIFEEIWFSKAYHIELKFSKVIPEEIWFSKACHIVLKFSKVIPKEIWFSKAYHIELKFSKLIPEEIWFSKASHIDALQDFGSTHLPLPLALQIHNTFHLVVFVSARGHHQATSRNVDYRMKTVVNLQN